MVLTKSLIRIFDILLSLIGLLLLLPLLILICFLVYIDLDKPIFLQKRVGRNLKTFVLIKFRTMSSHTKSTATHLINPNSITSLGKYLRKTKIDELPQLWNVLCGDMSLVGPRPCLLNQDELINERLKNKVFESKPGITGIAQIEGVDMSTPKLLAKIDQEMMEKMTLSLYFKLILLSIIGKGSGDKIRGE